MLAMRLIAVLVLFAACGDDGGGSENPNDDVPCEVMGAASCDRACVDQPVGGTGNASSECKVSFSTDAGNAIGRACTDDEVVVVDGQPGCCIYAGDPQLNDPFHVYWSACD